MSGKKSKKHPAKASKRVRAQATTERAQAAANAQGLGWAATLAAAAGRTQIPLLVIQSAKEAGCDAFTGNGRVNCDRLLLWLAQNPQVMSTAGEGMSLAEAEARKARADALIREHRLEVLRRSVIPADEMRRTFTRAVFGAKARLLGIPSAQAQSLASEPDPIEVEQELRKAIMDALSDLEKNEWAKCVCGKCGAEVKP